jgi:hypothetical protein
LGHYGLITFRLFTADLAFPKTGKYHISAHGNEGVSDQKDNDTEHIIYEVTIAIPLSSILMDQTVTQ